MDVTDQHRRRRVNKGLALVAEDGVAGGDARAKCLVLEVALTWVLAWADPVPDAEARVGIHGGGVSAWDHESTTSLRGAESGVKNVVKKHKALRTTPQKAAAAAAGIDRCCDEQ